MHRHARLISTLLLLLAAAGVCASYGGNDTLLTALRAAQAAAALGAIVAVASSAVFGIPPTLVSRLSLPLPSILVPPVMITRTVVLLC